MYYFCTDYLLQYGNTIRERLLAGALWKYNSRKITCGSFIMMASWAMEHSPHILERC